MKYKIDISDTAQRDIRQSIKWYEEQQNNLESYFIKMVDKSLNTISLNPEAFPKQKSNLRQIPLKIFPFVIVYQMKAKDTIKIIRIFHTSRSPKLKYKRK
jgi:toxin ParE1/3/4